jgi:hypothetical protein
MWRNDCPFISFDIGVEKVDGRTRSVFSSSPAAFIYFRIPLSLVLKVAVNAISVAKF